MLVNERMSIFLQQDYKVIKSLYDAFKPYAVCQINGYGDFFFSELVQITVLKVRALMAIPSSSFLLIVFTFYHKVFFLILQGLQRRIFSEQGLQKLQTRLNASSLSETPVISIQWMPSSFLNHVNCLFA